LRPPLDIKYNKFRTVKENILLVMPLIIVGAQTDGDAITRPSYFGLVAGRRAIALQLRDKSREHGAISKSTADRGLRDLRGRV